MNDVVEKETYTLIPDNDFDFLVWFDEQEKRAKVIRDKIKNDGELFLKERNLEEDGYKQTKDNVTIFVHKTTPYTKKQLDTQALKDEGLYDLYLKDVEVKGSIRIDISYENDD